MKKYPRLDIDGNDLRVGDWVRVIAVPLSIRNMPDFTKEAFSNAVGHTFQIVSFDETGCLHLEMWPKVSLDTIWLEPFCAKRSRRYKRLSKSFRRILEREAAPPPARYEVKFDIRLKEGVDIEEFGLDLIGLGTGGGFASWPAEGRIRGSVFADKAASDAIERLDNVRRIVAESEQIRSFEIGEIAGEDDA